jgi:hypothetical protein
MRKSSEKDLLRAHRAQHNDDGEGKLAEKVRKGRLGTSISFPNEGMSLMHIVTLLCY